MKVNEIIEKYIKDARNLRRVNDILNTIYNKRGTKLSHYTAIESIDPQVLTGVNKRLCTESLSGSNVNEISKVAKELETKLTNKINSYVLNDLTNIVERYNKTLSLVGYKENDNEYISVAEPFLGIKQGDIVSSCNWSTKITDEHVELTVKLELSNGEIISNKYRIEGKLERGLCEIEDTVFEYTSDNYTELKRFIVLINNPSIISLICSSNIFWLLSDVDDDNLPKDLNCLRNRDRAINGIIALLTDLQSITKDLPYQDYNELVGVLNRIENHMDDDDVYSYLFLDAYHCDFNVGLTKLIKFSWVESVLSILNYVRKAVTYVPIKIEVDAAINNGSIEVLDELTDFVKHLSSMKLCNTIVTLVNDNLQEIKPISFEYTLID